MTLKWQPPDFSAENKGRLSQAERVASSLGESGRLVLYNIRLLARVRGTAFVDELHQLTSEAEAGGGIMTLDGSRRRTPGGAFFALAKQRLTHVEWLWVANHYHTAVKRCARETAPQQAPSSHATS